MHSKNMPGGAYREATYWTKYATATSPALGPQRTQEWPCLEIGQLLEGCLSFLISVSLLE